MSATPNINSAKISGFPLNKFDATSAPTTGDDSADGYSVGSRWIDITNDKAYNCVDATASNAVWIEAGGASGGKVGIANTSGEYTYYATYTLALAAASSGETIEQFGNIVETGAVTLTIPVGVSINMNGYSYTLSGQAQTAVINTANNALQKVKLINGTIIHTGTGGGSYIYGLSVGNSPILDCTGLTVISDAAYALNYNTTAVGIGRITGGSFINSGNSTGWAGIVEGHVTGAYFNTDTCTSGLRVTGGSISNSIIDGLVTVLSAAELNNCRVIGSAQGTAVANQGTVNSCYITSETHYGISQSGNGKTFNSHVRSSANNGIFSNGANTEVDNCKIYSATTYGFYGTSDPEITNSEIQSLAFSAVRLNRGYMFNCKVKSLWNDASGDAVTLTQNDDSEILDCLLETTHADAKAITGAQSAKIRNCTGKGMTEFTDNTTNSLTTSGDAFNNAII